MQQLGAFRLILPLLMANLAFGMLIIPGTGCGQVQSPWKILEKLPTNDSIASLTCVMTKDQAGFERWKESRIQWTWTAPWSDCSVSCNGGTKVRTRECRNTTHVIDPSNCAVYGGSTDLNVTYNCKSQACPVKEACLYSNVIYEGVSASPNLITNIDSTQTCWELCNGQDDCNYYSYSAHHKQCYMFDSVTKKKFDRVFHSGSKNCVPDDPSNCLKYGLAPTANNGIYAIVTSTVRECYEACQTEPSCTTYLYRSWHTWARCDLYSSVTGDEYESVLATYGDRSCEPLKAHQEKCYEYMTHVNHDVQAPNQATPEECQAVCQEDALCKYWSYNMISGSCHMRNSEITSPSHYQAAYHFIAGKKDCNIVGESYSNCVKGRYTWDGTPIRTVNDISLPECSRECQADSSCNKWAHKLDNGECR